MKRKVTKPFHDPVKGRIVHPGESVNVTDNTRAAELEGNGMIEKLPKAAPKPANKNIPSAPSNKDASKQRRDK